jgi:hypothetical protein
VEEHRRHEPPPAAVVEVGRVEPEVGVDGAARVVESAALGRAEQVDRDVDRDQDPRDRRLPRRERDARGAANRARPEPRRRRPADTRVLGAADADGRERRAVGADGPAAVRAGEAGLAIGMPVAVARLDLRHPN